MDSNQQTYRRHVPAEKSLPWNTFYHAQKADSPQSDMHNEIRDVSTQLMSGVCHNVSIEPDLQPITGEPSSGASAITTDGARLDIAANGFW